ncbi:hypothetical protein MMC34_003826 [Xylographa carneopallida]|nr:hypothetical protein [Xylographa carneopallida]
MDPSTVALPPLMSAEAKDYAETTELAQEIEDMNFNYTYADAVALWNTIDLDAYFVEYEYQQEDFDLFDADPAGWHRVKQAGAADTVVT